MNITPVSAKYDCQVGTGFHKRSRGFTLIELLIVVVVVAILAAIAFPAYRDYVLRSNRAVAKSLLTQVADRQEQFFSSNKRYSASLQQLGFPENTFYVNGQGQAATGTAGAIYQVTLAAPNPQMAYTATAVPWNNQTDDVRCASFTLNQAGQRGAASPDCW